MSSSAGDGLRGRRSAELDMRFAVTCDFDGTITLTDTVNALLCEFAEPQWLDIEEEWCAGKLGSRECLAEQTKLLRITPNSLDAYLDAVEVDSDVKGFFEDCHKLGLQVSVVSDGYDWAIRRVLSRVGVKGVPIIANRLIHVGEDRWTVLFPHSAPNCGSGVCKCAAMTPNRLKLHIGDGRSDECVAQAADLVFAKSHLLKTRGEQGLHSVPFERFDQVRARLPSLQPLHEAATALLVQRSAAVR